MPHINDCFHWSLEENSRANSWRWDFHFYISNKQLHVKILEIGRKTCFPAPRNPDRNAQGTFQVDNDLCAAGPARRAANKNDFQLKSREPCTTSSFSRGAENAIVSHLKQLCHEKHQREAGLKAEEGESYVWFLEDQGRGSNPSVFAVRQSQAHISLEHTPYLCPTNSRAMYI